MISDGNKNITVCFNGKSYSKSFQLTLSYSTNSLKRLKDLILNSIKNTSSSSIEKIKIFNYKGIEIDDVDIEYLGNNQLLFISLDGSNFSNLNYLNEYEIIKKIKSGGYGDVSLAKHVLTGKLVAIKENNTYGLSNEEVYNISREPLYLESLKHKNIVKYRHSYSYDNKFYMVMDYAEGGELAQLIAEKNWLTEKEAKKIFSQIVEAVSFIHNRNVIHRDLKPNNILFLDKMRERVIIIDFGICGYSSGNIQEKVKAGTLKFVPPEVSIINYIRSLVD